MAACKGLACIYLEAVQEKLLWEQTHHCMVTQETTLWALYHFVCVYHLFVRNSLGTIE